MASLLLFLIGIPLNLGIALASGASATAGLASGVVGGLVVGTLTGCPLMVSGPATGLIAMIWQITDKHGFEALGPVCLMAGFFQIMIGILNLGPWFRAVAPAVIQGMLAGIGILIFASQFHVMLEQIPAKIGIINLLTIPKVLYEGFFGSGTQATHLAGILGALTILLTVLWSKLPGRAKLIPGSLIGIAVAILVARLGKFPVQFVQIPDDLVSEFHFMSVQKLSMLSDISIWGSVAALCFIATAQTLLTATAVDKLHGSSTNYNKEAIAQGAGNMAAGLLGILPLAGVIVRSATNIQAGASSRLSTILQGLWVSIFAFFFAASMKVIPISGLAAVLVYTGYRLVNINAIRELSRFSRGEVINYWVTLIAIVCTDLLTGIVAGFALSAARLIYVLTHCSTEFRQDPQTGASVVEIQGSATFFTLPALARALRRVPPGLEVHLFVSRLNYIDHACLEHLMSWEEQYINQGGQVYVEWDHLIGRFNRPLTREIAEKGAVQGAIHQIEQEDRGDTYDALVARGALLEIEASHYEEVVEQVVQVLGSKLDGNAASRVRSALLHEFAETGPPSMGYAAVPNLLLHELTRPELVLVRCKQGIRISRSGLEKPITATCLLFLLSPSNAVGEHLRVLAALASRLEEATEQAWLEAIQPEQLRDFLLRHRRFVSLAIQSGERSEEFAGKAVWEVASTLPASCLIAWLDREGKGIVPKGNTKIQVGDRITILGTPDDISEVFSTYLRA